MGPLFLSAAHVDEDYYLWVLHSNGPSKECSGDICKRTWTVSFPTTGRFKGKCKLWALG